MATSTTKRGSIGKDSILTSHVESIAANDFSCKSSSILRVCLQLNDSKIWYFNTLQVAIKFSSKMKERYTRVRWLCKAPYKSTFNFSHWLVIWPLLIESSSWHHKRSIVVYGNQVAKGFFRWITPAGLWSENIENLNQHTPKPF